MPLERRFEDEAPNDFAAQESASLGEEGGLLNATVVDSASRRESALPESWNCEKETEDVAAATPATIAATATATASVRKKCWIPEALLLLVVANLVALAAFTFACLRKGTFHDSCLAKRLTLPREVLL